ncbi:permease [Sinomonas atrocyanea]|uniref:DMT family transporter n=1 Tax=Sinomonas atrocyanea TaxID=37927 RepID=UPI00082F5D05|nr:EamA family transporter [Sinomonas atrocyanea]GEB62770.1 permease [Sinomonas atrocyanea]GGG62410.1 permease [Sinomonas atrocyanea]
MSAAREHRLGVVCVIGASVLWGTTGTASALAPGVTPLAVGAASMGFGGLLLAATAARQMGRHRATLARSWRLVGTGGAAVLVYALAFYTSMRLAGVAIGTAVSIGGAPVAAALLERLVDGRRLSRRWAVGAALGIAGAVVLCLARGGAEPGQVTQTLAGVALGALAAASYALYSFTSHRLIGAGAASRAAVGATFGAAALGLLVVLGFTGRAFLDSGQNLAVGAYLAVVPMFAGYILFGWGLSRVPASTATTVSLAEPVVAAALAVLVVGERLPLAGWAGMGLIVACLAVLTVPLPARSRRRARPEPLRVEG